MKPVMLWKKTLFLFISLLPASSLLIQSDAYSAASGTPLDSKSFIQEQSPQALPYISKQIPTSSDQLVPVIVQLSSEPAAVVQYAVSQGVTDISSDTAELTVQAEQTSFIAAAYKKGIDFTINYVYSTVLNGMEITLPASQVLSLAALPGVKAIHENHTYYSIPNEVLASIFKIAPLSQIGATDVWAQSLTSNGLKIGIIDTGIDYSHPDLIRAYKVLGNTYIPDSNGSGSYMNSGSSAQVIDSIERAVKDDMDVIILSLGSDITKDVNSLDTIAINNAVLAGAVAVAATGNAGAEYYTMGSPASAQLGISVGATDPSSETAALSPNEERTHAQLATMLVRVLGMFHPSASTTREVAASVIHSLLKQATLSNESQGTLTSKPL